MSTTVGTQSATITRVATSTASATLAAASASRRMVHIVNEATVTLYVKFGATATSTDYTVPIAAGGYFELPTGNPYAGRIDAILASGAASNAQVTVY